MEQSFKLPKRYLKYLRNIILLNNYGDHKCFSDVFGNFLDSASKNPSQGVVLTNCSIPILDRIMLYKI